MQTINELIPLIQQWGKEKGINDPYKQTLKLHEEAGELAAAVIKDRKNDAIDAVGDCIVVLAILCDILGINMEHALNVAWNEIKGRVGETRNGNFIKQEDINY